MKIVWTVLFFTLGLGCGLIIDDFAGNKAQAIVVTSPVSADGKEAVVTLPVRPAESRSPGLSAEPVPVTVVPSPEPTNPEDRVRLLARTGRIAEALDLAESTTGDESVFGRLVAEAAIGLSEVDPVAAVRWVADPGFGHRIAQETSVLALFRTLSEKDPKGAAGFSGMVGGDPNDDLRSLATHAVAEVWAKQSPAEAAGWAMTKPEAPSLLITVLEQWSTDDPKEALRHLPDMLPLLSAADAEAISRQMRQKAGID